MNIAVIGSGGREHALCYKIKQSKKVKNLFCIPGNAGTKNFAKNLDIDILNFGAGEMAWRIWVNVNNVESVFLNIPLPNIYLFKDGRHNSGLAVLEKLYDIFGISQKFYVPKQTYYPNPKYQSDSFYYRLNTDTDEFCSIFQFACKFSKKLSILH